MRNLDFKSTKNNTYWQFRWLRENEGYAIQQHEPEIGRKKLSFIVPVRIASSGDTHRVPIEDGEPYDLGTKQLDNSPGISREFLTVRDDATALAFANKFGLLGLEGVPQYSNIKIELKKKGERVNFWIQEATELSQAYEIWDRINRDPGSLSTVIFAKEGGTVVIPDPRRSPTMGVRPATGLKRAGMVLIAKEFIAEIYNWKMDRMASPVLLLDANNTFHTHSRPSSLLAALWLEFGGVVLGSRKESFCLSCGQLMDVTNNRGDKRKHDHCIHRESMARYRAKIKNPPSAGKSNKK